MTTITQTTSYNRTNNAISGQEPQQTDMGQTLRNRIDILSSSANYQDQQIKGQQQEINTLKDNIGPLFTKIESIKRDNEILKETVSALENRVSEVKEPTKKQKILKFLALVAILTIAGFFLGATGAAAAALLAHHAIHVSALLSAGGSSAIGTGLVFPVAMRTIDRSDESLFSNKV